MLSREKTEGREGSELQALLGRRRHCPAQFPLFLRRFKPLPNRLAPTSGAPLPKDPLGVLIEPSSRGQQTGSSGPAGAFRASPGLQPSPRGTQALRRAGTGHRAPSLAAHHRSRAGLGTTSRPFQRLWLGCREPCPAPHPALTSLRPQVPGTQLRAAPASGWAVAPRGRGGGAPPLPYLRAGGRGDGPGSGGRGRAPGGGACRSQPLLCLLPGFPPPPSTQLGPRLGRALFSPELVSSGRRPFSLSVLTPPQTKHVI